jgi:predicted RNA-binding Zn-ribbon protein involved in translation (DUF1610 family)
MLFKCSVCSKSLAVDVSLLGRRFICPECQTKIHAPRPEIVFRCPKCGCDLAAPEKLEMQDFECPNCQQTITIPEMSTVPCPSCGANIELDHDYYRELAGKVFDCPECGERVPVPALPGTGDAESAGANDETLLPKGFGHKTMKIDDIVASMTQAERMKAGLCPYCGSKLHVLRGSYVCRSCGRIMRKATTP